MVVGRTDIETPCRFVENDAAGDCGKFSIKTFKLFRESLIQIQKCVLKTVFPGAEYCRM